MFNCQIPFHSPISFFVLTIYIFYCNHLTEKQTSTTEMLLRKRNDFNSGQKNYFHEVMQ